MVSPLETLVTDRSRQAPIMTAMFGLGSSVIRRELAPLGLDSTLIVTPLRGAMPMVWSAEGVVGLEGGTDNRFLEVPTGEYVFQDLDGSIKCLGPDRGQSQKIVRHYLDQAFADPDIDPFRTELILLDEVQKGGSISTLNEIIRTEMRRRSMSPYLRVIAAQDNRQRVAAQPKTESYKQLSSNSVPRTSVFVVPMPLLATDKADLLDKVVLEGRPRDLGTDPGRLTVYRNLLAETLFRTIGTMARREDIRHDESFKWDFVNGQGPMSERGSAAAEGWLKRLVALFDEMGLEKR